VGKRIRPATVEARVGPAAQDLSFGRSRDWTTFVIGDPYVPNDGSKGTAFRLTPDDDEMTRSRIDVIKAGLADPATILRPDSRTSPLSLANDVHDSLLGDIQEEIRQSLAATTGWSNGIHTANGKPLLANDTTWNLVPPMLVRSPCHGSGWNG